MTWVIGMPSMWGYAAGISDIRVSFPVKIERACDPPFPLDLLVRTPTNFQRRLAEGDSLWDAPNLLLQKFPAPAFTATTGSRSLSLGPRMAHR
jgi:hypothetical protein